jgi:hypothetical protein
MKTNQDIEKKFEIFITLSTLEKAGFEHFDAINFVILFMDDSSYILNKKDHSIVRFKGKTPLKVFKEEGQGPGGLIDPRSVFFYDPETLAIFDITKASVLLFDLDLNYKKEVRVNTDILKLQDTKNGFVAFGTFGEYLFAKLDSNFNVIETFVKAKKTTPFRNMYPQSLNMGYLLTENKIAHTSWLFTSKNCKADIFDINTQKNVASLNWEQSHSPTQKDIDNRTNMYSSNYIGKYGKYYVVHNSFFKNIRGHGIHELLIFYENGKLHSKHDFPFNIIQCYDASGDTRIYFMDENEDISFFDLSRL